MNSFFHESVNYQIGTSFVPITDLDNASLVEGEREVQHGNFVGN
jgi:hypothetical protein